MLRKRKHPRSLARTPGSAFDKHNVPYVCAFFFAFPMAAPIERFLFVDWEGHPSAEAGSARTLTGVYEMAAVHALHALLPLAYAQGVSLAAVSGFEHKSAAERSDMAARALSEPEWLASALSRAARLYPAAAAELSGLSEKSLADIAGGPPEASGAWTVAARRIQELAVSHAESAASSVVRLANLHPARGEVADQARRSCRHGPFPPIQKVLMEGGANASEPTVHPYLCGVPSPEAKLCVVARAPGLHPAFDMLVSFAEQ